MPKKSQINEYSEMYSSEFEIQETDVWVHGEKMLLRLTSIPHSHSLI